MDVVITEWALQSYLSLKYRNVFTSIEDRSVLRPDVELLRDDFHSAAKDKRECAKLKRRNNRIALGQYQYRGTI